VLRDATELTEGSGRPLRQNVIEGGDGFGEIDGTASAGLLIRGLTNVDVIASTMRPGKSLGKAVELRGVHSESSGSIRIVQSRIYGGDLSNPADSNLGFRVGAWIQGAQSFFAENDMIYGGVPIAGFTGGSPSFALALTDVGEASVVHSTLYSGPSGYPTVGTALKINGGVLGAVVQNNILAADSGWNEPIYVEVCASMGVFKRLENNLLFNADKPTGDVVGNILGYGWDPKGSCYGWQPLVTIDELTAHVQSSCSSSTPGACQSFGGSKVSGNVTLNASCGTDSGCIPWAACNSTTSLACLQSVFEGWSEPQNGLDTLFGPGWKLAAGVPCAVAKSSLSLGLATDAFGTMRTAPPSMGAHEHDGACTP
jgi:hypothetical protein